MTPPPPPFIRLEAPREDDERVVERVAPRRVDGHGIQQVARDFGGGEVRRDDFQRRAAPPGKHVRRAEEAQLPEAP